MVHAQAGAHHGQVAVAEEGGEHLRVVVHQARDVGGAVVRALREPGIACQAAEGV